MQVASTCRKLSEAAAELLARPGTRLNLTYGPDVPNIFSGLLIKWAPTCSTLCLSSNVFNEPGHAAFLAQAQRLHALRLEPGVRQNTVTAAAQADCIISRCSGITNLHWRIKHLPCALPCTLQRLSGSLCCCGADERGATADDLAQALIIRLDMYGVSLQSLALDMSSVPILAGPVLLPELQELSISFAVSGTPVDLAWLHAQPHRRLCLDILLVSNDYAVQSQALKQIQQLQVHCLMLCAMTSREPCSSCGVGLATAAQLSCTVATIVTYICCQHAHISASLYLAAV